MTLYFRTPGIMDVKHCVIHGLSAKETADAIGRFGTGFKYSIAGILRMGGSIHVHTPLETFHFTAVDGVFRGKPFQQVHMNGVPLGFTTELGKHWQPWHLYRELYSNTLDEGGTVSATADAPIGLNETIIVVKGLDEVYRNRKKWFISDDDELLWEKDYFQLYSSKNGAGLFNNGIYVFPESAPQLMYRYNIAGHLALSEDRLAMYPRGDMAEFQNALFMHCDNVEILSNMFIKTVNTLENCFDIPSMPNRPALEETLRRVQRLEGMDYNRIGRLRDIVEGEKPPEEYHLSEIEKKQLARALDVLKRVGHEVTFEIKVMKTLGRNVHGEARDGKIYLSPLAFEKGTKWLTSTILEEFVHLERGYSDCSYEMQNFLFDIVMSQFERILGEPI